MICKCRAVLTHICAFGQMFSPICKHFYTSFCFRFKLFSDAVHGDGFGEADEDAEAVGRKDSVFGLSDVKRP